MHSGIETDTQFRLMWRNRPEVAAVPSGQSHPTNNNNNNNNNAWKYTSTLAFPFMKL
jgi:hypothetical protein